MSDDKGEDCRYGPCSTPDCGGEGWAVLNDGTVQCVGCFNAYFGGTNTATNTTTDQPAHYTAGSVEVIDTIREALGDEGFRAFCRGNVIKYAMRAGRKGDAAEDMRKAANYARWASGEEWRPGRGVTRPNGPTACTKCGNDDCTDMVDGLCCDCWAYDVGVGCHECAECEDRAYRAGVEADAADAAKAEAPPRVADILGKAVTVDAWDRGGGWRWLAMVDMDRCGGCVTRHNAYGDTAADLRAGLIRSIRASGVMVPGE